MFRWHDAYTPSGNDSSSPKFKVGQRIKHVRYHYQGLIVAMDSEFKASDAWYQKNKTQPVKNQAWYHVLVHGSSSVTYAAESSLQMDPLDIDFKHPLLALFFDGKEGGFYKRNNHPWPGHS